MWHYATEQPGNKPTNQPASQTATNQLPWPEENNATILPSHQLYKHESSGFKVGAEDGTGVVTAALFPMMFIMMLMMRHVV